MYWENIDFNTNRKLLLKELYDIKAGFGRGLFNDYVHSWNGNNWKKKQKDSSDPEFDNVRFLKERRYYR